MSLPTYFLLFLEFVTFIAGPIALVWTFVDRMLRKASDRPSGGGGVSNFVGAGLRESIGA